MATGRIKYFDEDTGNGWIEPDSGGDDVQFDRKHIQNDDGEAISVGEPVIYEVEGGLAGTAATHVRRLSGRRRSMSAGGDGAGPIL